MDKFKRIYFYIYIIYFVRFEMSLLSLFKVLIYIKKIVNVYNLMFHYTTAQCTTFQKIQRGKSNNCCFGDTFELMSTSMMN